MFLHTFKLLANIPKKPLRSGFFYVNKKFSSLKLQPTQRDYENERLKQLQGLYQKTGVSYPAHCRRTLSLEEFRKKYSYLKPEEELTQETLFLVGRIYSKRESSKKLIFLDIGSEGGKLQVRIVYKHYHDKDLFEEINSIVKRGDIIEVFGYPCRTKSGELSILCHQINLLSPCLLDLPQTDSLKDKFLRYKQRYLDLLTRPASKNIFLTRAKIISEIRRWFDQNEFVEVETPTLSNHAEGALASPFLTHSKALEADLFLRIAPELYLKQLVVGGLDRVFEIGKQFRNEGVDSTHNPEFTTCEFYEAYADYDKMMDRTESLLKHVIRYVNDGLNLIISVDGGEDTICLDFEKPFRRISIIEEIESKIGRSLPDVNDPNSIPELKRICESVGIELVPPHNNSRLVDALVEHFIEPQCVQPTFIIDFPIITSPLAKKHRTKPGVTERFELYINRMEIANAYSELNDPYEQAKRFEIQKKEQGINATELSDWSQEYVLALKHGLPPTSGCGIGIDRLVMLITNQSSIREVLLFPYVS